MKYIEIGKITNTHGLKGELKIKAYTDFNRFDKDNYIYVYYNNTYNKLFINSSRPNNEQLLVSFKDYLDINLVEKFKNCLVYIDETQQEELEDDEYYIEDLISLKVYNQNDDFIGVVSGVRQLPQGYILEIKRENKKPALVPFVDKFILDVLEDKIIINEIEGLL